MTGNQSAGCDGKFKYNTYYEAKKAAARLRRYHHEAKMNPYKCSYCDKFHVGNSKIMRHRRTNRHNMKGYLGHGRIQISGEGSDMAETEGVLRNSNRRQTSRSS